MSKLVPPLGWARVLTAHGGEWLVVADVDGTLLGDGEGWARLRSAIEANPVILVPNSSRPLVSLRRTWEIVAGSLRFPAQVGALGTEVSIGDRDVGWSDRFRGFRREPIDSAMFEMGFQTNGAEFQTPLKASYSVPRARWREVTSTLKSHSQVEVVTSGISDLDVIPTGAGKAVPIASLAGHFRVASDHIVAAGDTMNDLSMLEAATHRIVVGNAEPDLIDATRGTAFHSVAVDAQGVLAGLRALGALP